MFLKLFAKSVNGRAVVTALDFDNVASRNGFSTIENLEGEFLVFGKVCVFDVDFPSVATPLFLATFESDFASDGELHEGSDIKAIFRL